MAVTAISNSCQKIQSGYFFSKSVWKETKLIREKNQEEEREQSFVISPGKNITRSFCSQNYTCIVEIGEDKTPKCPCSLIRGFYMFVLLRNIGCVAVYVMY